MENPGAAEVASYAISVRLDPQDRRLTGRETILYRNAAQEPITDLVFHLYLNGFKNAQTIFMRESGGEFRGDEFTPQKNGWIEVDNLSIARGAPLDLELLEDGTLARADLPQPVLPGESVEVEVLFHAQLPQVFSRTGWALDEQGDLFFLVGQWFPKLGVWTDAGWNAYAFHGNAEFFADFGSYRVAISVPEEYQTGATGLPGGSQDREDGYRTDFYTASGVIDFAWTASPNLKSASRKAGSLEIDYLYLPEHEWSAKKVLDIAERSATVYSEMFGPYPYPRLTVVDVPEKGAGAGGMEYPMFVTVGASGSGEQSAAQSGWTSGLEIVAAHEVAHQWWQSVVATNEAEEPWLDEGFAEYSTILYLTDTYGLSESAIQKGDFPSGFLQGRRNRYLSNADVPMEGNAWDFQTWEDYVTAAYAKPVLSLMTLERVIGKPKMRDILQTYFERYRFAHPTSADFRAVAVEVSGDELSWFFDGLVESDDTLNYVAQAIGDRSITVAREGDLMIPTEIEVDFSDGTKKTLAWEGVEKTKTFSVEKPVDAFDIDPARKLLVDLNWNDNEIKR
jgi:hypothetical protein